MGATLPEKIAYSIAAVNAVGVLVEGAFIDFYCRHEAYDGIIRACLSVAFCFAAGMSSFSWALDSTLSRRSSGKSLDRL